MNTLDLVLCIDKIGTNKPTASALRAVQYSLMSCFSSHYGSGKATNRKAVLFGLLLGLLFAYCRGVSSKNSSPNLSNGIPFHFKLV